MHGKGDNPFRKPVSCFELVIAAPICFKHFLPVGGHRIIEHRRNVVFRKPFIKSVTIYEPGLEKLFLRNLREERLSFTTSLEEGVREATIIFLALPTPQGEDGSADLKYVLSVAQHLGKIMKGYKIIVDKSTVPVGTAEKVHDTIADNYNGEVDVVSNPEFLREGVAVDDFMKPDRVVIGTNSERARKLLNDLYSPFVRQGNPIIFMDERSAELPAEPPWHLARPALAASPPCGLPPGTSSPRCAGREFRSPALR